MAYLQPQRRRTRHRKKLLDRPRPLAALAIVAVIGLALIVATTVPALFSPASKQRRGYPAPTVTVPGPRATVTITVPRPGPTVPGPTVTVTELRPGPTVTIRCHPGRRCTRA